MKAMTAFLLAIWATQAMAAPDSRDGKIGSKNSLEARTAVPGQGGREHLVASILNVSGIEANLRQLADRMVEEGVQSSIQSNADPREIEATRRVFKDAYPSSGFVSATSSALKKNYDEVRYRNIVAMLSTPLASKMVAFETQQPSFKDMQTFAMQIEKQPLTDERMKLIRLLEASMGSGEFSAKNQIASMRMMALTQIEGCPDRKATFEKEFSKQQRNIQLAVRESVVMMMAFLYRTASNAELKDYLQFVGRQDIKWLNGLVTATMNTELGKGRLKLWEHYRKLAADRERKESMFAAKCAAKGDIQQSQRIPGPSGTASAGNPPHVGGDARSCLQSEDPAKVRACAEKYR